MTTPDRSLATFLLAAALFVCHGVFGYEHQLTPPAEPKEAPEISAAPHTQHHGPTAPDRGDEHPSDGGYYATLLVMLLGAVLLRGVAPASLRLPGPKLPAISHRKPVFNLPRGPTAPTLQVFRL